MLEILDILVKTFLIMGSLYILMEAILMAKHYIKSLMEALNAVKENDNE